ncbi:MAG TPA: phosphatase PAP2 family protein [Candidatus Tectomicrobia bacterium]|jgi:undecaprenyl-diphosphatase
MLTFVERLDHQLFFAINQGLSTPLLDYLLWWASVLGDGLVLTLATGLGLWWRDRQAFRQHYGWLVVAVLAGGIVVQLLKHGIGRPRPMREFATLLQAGAVQLNVIGHSLQYRSFPSGHAQAAAAVCTYLLYLYPRRWYWWGLIPLLVGLSRIYLGAHFPLDVLVGLGLGSLGALGAWRLQRLLACRLALDKRPGDF